MTTKKGRPRMVVAEGTQITCYKCRQAKPTSEFHRSPLGVAEQRKGWQAYCKTCIRQRDRATYRTRVENGFFKSGKGLARSKFRDAVKCGRIKRLPCEVCGSAKSEGHHHKGYAKRHWFDVQWLCRTHHAEAEPITNRKRKK